MSYTGASPVLGRGTATAGQIDRWFAQRGPAYAPQYAPDGQYLAPPPLGASIVAISRTLGVNSDLVAAQVLKETAAWQSRYARERNNPGGLGAINSNPDLAIRFASPAAGIRAHISHLCTYVRGEGVWTADDPRYSATPVAWRGSVTTLSELDGKWAYPGVGYGAGIARLANDLLTIGDAPMDAFEMPLSIAGIPVRKSFIPAGNSNRPGTPATAEGRQWITVHETANFNKGANAEMHRRFTHGAGGWGGGGHPATADTEEYEGVSFTFCVDDHEIVWLLPLEEKSWQASDGANGPGNSSTSIEKCVNADGDPAKTSENLAQLVGYLAMRHPEKSPDRVAQHNKWARDGKNCPAQMRANGGAGWNALMARVQELSRPGNESVRFFPETGFIVGHGFLAFWSQFGDDATSVAVFGYPLTEEIQEDGRTVQYFERSVFEYWPENPPEYTVLLRRLGADALEAA